MIKKLFKYEIIGFVFVSILGTLSHFFFEWSGSNTIIGLFCPVNESPWEHLKLLWFPYLLWAIIEFFVLDRPKNFWPSKLIGASLGNVIILSVFYTGSGIIGKSSMVIDISSYFIGVLAAFFIDYVIIKSGKMKGKTLASFSIAIIIVICIMYFMFTFNPPLLPLFRDPQELTYGI